MPATPEAKVVITVRAEDASRRAAAEALAARLALPLAEDESALDPEATICLRVLDTRLELALPADRPGRGVHCEFESIDVRTGSGNLSRKQPLARAIGSKTRTVIDATAGLGHDSLLLACMGYDVTAVERSPVLAAILGDGVRAAGQDPLLAGALGNRLRVICADARAVIEAASPPPDAVYIDPMFPPKRKRSALPKKGMQLLRRIVGDDPDAADLVTAARRRVHRVAVKRPTHEAPLAGPPDVRIEGKLVRYDVYVQEV